MQKILLAEDDPNLGELIKDYLELKGKFEVNLCEDGVDAIEAFKKSEYDLCILDVMMPKKDGFSVGKEIRRIDKTIPIIYATAKGMMEDKTQAFELGGDDYITKPFRIEELLLRINALLKRSTKDKKAEAVTKFELGDFSFDSLSQTLTYKEEDSQKLSTKESELLRLLCLNKNEVLTREEALVKIWHDDNYFTGRSMDVFLSKLRKYLRKDSNIEIVNVHGKGYKLLISD